MGEYDDAMSHNLPCPMQYATQEDAHDDDDKSKGKKHKCNTMVRPWCNKEWKRKYDKQKQDNAMGNKTNPTWNPQREKWLEIDEEQDGYNAKNGSFTTGVLQLSSTTRGSRPEI